MCPCPLVSSPTGYCLLSHVSCLEPSVPLDTSCTLPPLSRRSLGIAPSSAPPFSCVSNSCIMWPSRLAPCRLSHRLSSPISCPPHPVFFVADPSAQSSDTCIDESCLLRRAFCPVKSWMSSAIICPVSRRILGLACCFSPPLSADLKPGLLLSALVSLVSCPPRHLPVWLTKP